MDSEKAKNVLLRWYQLLASLLFVIVAFLLDDKANGIPAIHWMYVYSYDEFDTWGKIWAFLWDLRTGVSPFWGFIDAASFKIFGNIHLTEFYLYHGAIYLAFVLPIWFYAKNGWHVILGFVLSLIAVLATLAIHKGNAQVYDMYFPALILLLIKGLEWIRKPETHPRLRIVLSIAVGLLFTISELTRPFVLVVVPFFIFGVWEMLKPYPRVNFVALLIPILLLSGTWHLKLLLRNGQISWTNHTGFNLHRCWNNYVDFNEFMAYQEAPSRLGAGKSPNLNTDLHAQNSKDLVGKVFRGILREPFYASKHILKRAIYFWTPQRKLFKAELPDRIYRPYQIVVWATGLSLLLAMIFWLKGVLKGRLKFVLDSLADPERMLMLFLVLNITIYTVAEAGEDARFMISVLPMLLCFPGLGAVPRPRKRINKLLPSRLLQK